MRYSSDLIVESLRSQFDGTDINEAKVVTFDGKVNPNFGHAVIMAGGAGSGKGFALEKKGSTFVVPDKVYRKVMVVTGRNEVDPKAPKNYLSQGDFRKDFDKKVDAVRGGSMTVRKRKF